MSRQLASIQRVKEIVPIQGAGSIELARVLGWQVVVKKGEFSVGDLGVFFEIDSVLPRRAWSEFLFKKEKETETTFRLRTIRLRGALSQGLLLPLSSFDNFDIEGQEGDEVTEQLGVVLYEPPQKEYNPMRAARPENLLNWFYNIPKTDETRLQSVPAVLDELVIGEQLVITQKADGQSVTAFWDEGEGRFRTGSRNFEIAGDWKFTETFNNFPELFQALNLMVGRQLVFQGEFVGAGIQKDRMGYGKGYRYIFFNVFEPETGRYWDALDVMGLSLHFVQCSTDAAFNPFQVITVSEEDKKLETWIERANLGWYGSGHRQEGIVVRPLRERFSPTLRGRLSFKVISPEFLLKIGE